MLQSFISNLGFFFLVQAKFLHTKEGRVRFSFITKLYIFKQISIFFLFLFKFQFLLNKDFNIWNSQITDKGLNSMWYVLRVEMCATIISFLPVLQKRFCIMQDTIQILLRMTDDSDLINYTKHFSRHDVEAAVYEVTRWQEITQEIVYKSCPPLRKVQIQWSNWTGWPARDLPQLQKCPAMFRKHLMYVFAQLALFQIGQSSSKPIIF